MFFRATVADAPANFFERLGHNGIDTVSRREVRLDLLGAPSGFELRHQIGGTDYVFAQAAQQIDGAAIDQRNGKNDVVGRVLHGEIEIVRQDGLQFVE